MSQDIHSGCEMCGIVVRTQYTEGQGYLCPACLAGEEDAPPLCNDPTDAEREETRRTIEFAKNWNGGR